MMRSTDECEMSRSCHSAMSSSAACRLPRNTRASPQSCSDLIGLRLCGIALEPFCALAKRLLGLAHLGALQMADLERERLDARAHRRARVEHLGVAIARQHLGRRNRPEAEALAHVTLDRGIDVGERADRARQLADRDRVAGAQQPLPVAPDLHRPERQLHAERGGLGVDAVRAPDHRRVAELARPRRDRRLQLLGRGKDAVERTRHLQCERGVDHVARREAVVHPRPRGLADALLHDVDERGDIVVGDLLALVHRGHVDPRALAHGSRRVGRNDAELGPRLDREDLDLEPRAEARLVGEEVGDVGERVAGDHESAWAAMSRR